MQLSARAVKDHEGGILLGSNDIGLVAPAIVSVEGKEGGCIREVARKRPVRPLIRPHHIQKAGVTTITPFFSFPAET